jgi:antitoxin MazE
MSARRTSAVAKVEASVVRVGNSRGIRLPRALIDRYRIGEKVTLELREDGILLHGNDDGKLSWEDSAREMAASGEDWSEWDVTLADGLDELPW